MQPNIAPSLAVYHTNAAAIAPLLAGLQARGVTATPCDLREPVNRISSGGAVVIVDPDDPQAPALVDRLLARLGQRDPRPLICGVPETFAPPRGAAAGIVRAGASAEELIGRATELADAATAIARLEAELAQLRRLSAQASKYFDDIDGEMRLAGRLQRDFLPSSAIAPPGLRIASLFRPASWVSGDLFDVIPIDERRTALFICDAMGHGASAALLTMFMRRSLLVRRETDGAIIPPTEVVARLSAELERQQLPQSQFVTGAYGIFDAATCEIAMARGGHPYPIRISARGEASELTPEGGLLGISCVVSDFEPYAATLAPGDKLLLYTDGLEELFVTQRDGGGKGTRFCAHFAKWATGSAQDFVDQLADFLDRQEGSLNPADDITTLVVEVLG